MRMLRFLLGLVVALTIHSLLNKFFPNALAFVDVYLVLVVYYATGGNLIGTIIAAILAGFVQDAFSNAIFGLHAFALTFVGYLVGVLSSKIDLRNPLWFGLTVAGSIILNELVVYALVNILLSERIELFGQALLLKTVITSLLGVLAWQAVQMILRPAPLRAARRA